MRLARPIRTALYFISCLFILLAFGPRVGSAHAEADPRDSSVSAPKSMVLLYSYGDGIPAYQEATRGFLSIMREGRISSNNLFFEYLDLERKRDIEHIENLTTLFRHKYDGKKIDLVVTVHTKALKFIFNEGKDLFPGAPVLSYLAPDTIETEEIERPVLILPMRMDFKGTLELALKLFPQTKRVVFINGVGEGEKRLELEARSVFVQWRDRLEFEYTKDLSVEEMLQRIATLPPRSIVLYSNVFRDKTDRTFLPRDVAEMVARAANAPVFGMFNTVIENGVIGGSVFNFEGEGARAGTVALDILKGNLSLTKPVTILAAGRIPMFDWQQLKRWGVEEIQLPKETIFVNRAISFWDQYKRSLIGVVFLLLAQSFLIIVLLFQIRRRRSAEKAFFQKTEELDQFFSVTLDLLCVANTDGYFLRLNPAWETILGYSREELMAGRFFDFIHPDDLGKTDDIVSTLASQERVPSFVNRYRCKDGTYRWLEWTAVPAGNLIYAAARDITERLEAEAEARHRREELAHVARIATMGELTTSLAHEINQPLAAIRSNAEAAQRFLSQAAPDISEVRQILDDIIRDDRRAGEVVQKVRALVRKETPLRELLDLNEAIQEVAALIRADSLLQGLSIAMELSPDLKRIRGDRVQLEQVVLNLILNSAAAMKNAPRTQRKIIVRTGMKDSETVKASVTDFGTGIDENNIDRLFELFYTTKPEGLGMGLSISQRIIHAHGGAMEASNNPEGGATFAFTLPAHEGDPT